MDFTTSQSINQILHKALSLPDEARPFPWQEALLDRFLDSERKLPPGLDIPTGLGKTSSFSLILLS